MMSRNISTRLGSRPLPIPEPGPDAAALWVGRHLGHLVGDDAPPSPRFRGGQAAADAALAGFDVAGYAARRNEVWPEGRRGASGLSPYIRHGLLSLPRVWSHVEGGPKRDVVKFRDELLWQEYARHWYGRLGEKSAHALRFEAPRGAGARQPWPEGMACVERAQRELHRDGWLVNQARMWLASQWSVRAGADWRAGEEIFFQQLLDGSRAANRMGWQWTVGTANGKPYGFSRWQVEKRSPGLCDACGLRARCPIQAWPPRQSLRRRQAPPELEAHGDVSGIAGPSSATRRGAPSAVWLTAESLGWQDPALAAHPELTALFVFDEALLARWRLSAKRLIFLIETLSELASRRSLRLWLGSPREVLAGQPLAATFTPVPGWKRICAGLDVVELHPWPWLRRPDSGSVASFSQWRRGQERGPRRARQRRAGSRSTSRAPKRMPEDPHDLLCSKSRSRKEEA